MERKQVLEKLREKAILSVEATTGSAHSRKLETPYGDVMIKLDDGTSLVAEGEPLTVILPRGCEASGVFSDCGLKPTLIRLGENHTRTLRKEARLLTA